MTAANISIHRFSLRQEPGDLTGEDMLVLWGLLKAERLVDVFFHDGAVRDYAEFIRYARCNGWFYAVKRDGAFIGIGVVNDFTSSGNTAFAHFCTFKGGRDGSFAVAARLWFAGLAEAGLDTLIAVLPHCYRASRKWAEDLGFKPVLVAPRALRLVRGGKYRTADACVYVKDLAGMCRQEGGSRAAGESKNHVFCERPSSARQDAEPRGIR